MKPKRFLANGFTLVGMTSLKQVQITIKRIEIPGASSCDSVLIAYDY